ncbi:MAG: hypothetical protein HY043_06480 [Verrucomicrobia bacterium]|nr:hypothetical protein [Verrucomicrobiota bacterium]
MSAHTEQRKLAAIMFTDMLDYSAPAQRNEVLATFEVPQGRPTIAQRFIAGLAEPSGKVPQGRKKIAFSGWRIRSTLSPLRGLAALGRFPSVETLGYGLSPSGLVK